MKGDTLVINTEQAHQKAIEAHKAGKLQEAEQIYRAILQNKPNHPHANHNLGVIAMSMGKAGAALPLFKVALEADPKQGQFWLSYVDALIKEKQFDNARNVLEQGKKSGLTEEKIRLLQAKMEASSKDQKHSTSENNELSPALALRELGRYQEAEEWLIGFLSSRIDDAAAWSLLSQVYLLNKKDAAAEKALSQAISINPYLPSVYRNQARLLLKQNKAADALEKAQCGYEKCPDDPESWLALAACLGANQRDNEALPLVERALQFKPNYAEAFVNRAMIRLRKKNTIDAIKDAEMAVALKPHLGQVWGLLGSLRYQHRNRSGAIEALRKAHQLDRNNLNYLVDLGELLREEGKVTEAILILEEATTIAPENANAWTNFGTALQQSNRIDDAKSAFEKALAINPKLALVLNNLGTISKDASDLDTARQYFNQAIASEPNFAEAHSNLAATLNVQGRLVDAESSYRKAIVLKPDLAGTHSNLGGTLQALGRMVDAEASYRKAIELDSGHAAAHYNLGNLLRELGRLEDAEASYKKALALNPEFAEAYNNLGVILHELGRLQEAEETYRKVLVLKPNYAEATNCLGVTLQELGRLEEAELAYRKAVLLKPDYQDGLYNLGVWLFDTRQYDKATAVLKLTNFKNSKSYLMKCLYAQNEQVQFYELLDSLISQGESNPIIGSLGCRAEIRYGVTKPNSFCNDPFKYVLQIDLSRQYDFHSNFIKPITTILSEKKSRERIQTHLTNGRQTFGNLFTLERDLTKEIKKIIHAEVEKYRTCFKDSEEGIIKKWPIEYDLYGWLISMKSGGKLRPHMHEKGWISGSVYINVPSKSRTDSGNLVVCIDDEDYLVDGKTSHENIIDVTTGSLCLFPASLLHYTIPFESEEDRIVLAFDVMPK